MTLTITNKLGFLRVIFWFNFALLGASEVAKFKVTEWKGCPESEFRYLAIPQLSIGECAHECKIRPICKSVVYRRLLHLCEIFSTENEIVLKSPGRSPCVFIRRNDIEQDQDPWCNCTERQVYNTLTGACTVKECSPYNETDFAILGNQNHIGAKVEIACDLGWETLNPTATCQSDGNWSQELQCTQKCPVMNTILVHQEGTSDFRLQFHLEKISQSDAMAECEKSQTRLVRIDSEVKRSYVTNILTACRDLSKYNYWTDGSNKNPDYPNDCSMWFSDGTKMPLGNKHWQDDRPIKYDSSTMCARMESYSDFRWRDAYCYENNTFICEKIPQ
ncbi:uncharacterized protein LOC123529140 [Mercenaria mercenaria]|uniref:uncharacterized protein LOC123529140 n=1 Tax=Mercenaria mercenaria TaxID=6596 RepID=UPI00234EBE43|nr:uncharacterized protein LOC123529140 [Mercenaria mercenaria]